MKKYSRILAALLFILFLLPSNIYAQSMDALEQAYKEQYLAYSKESRDLQKLIADYGKCIEEKDIIDREMTSLYEDYRLGRISKRDSLPKRIELTEANLRVLTAGLNVFNEAKGEQRSDISISEIKMDQDFSRKRLKEISDKKRELKIKVLEKKGMLPSWWID